MIYLIVLLGSLLGICLILGFRVLLRNRAARTFVRSIRARIAHVEQRSPPDIPETPVKRPRRNPRTSAIEMQQVRSLVRKAEKDMAQGRFIDAERAFIQALTIQPHAVDVQASLAKFYLDTNREQKAEAMYRELLLQRDDVSFHGNLGTAYYRQGKYIEACFAFQEALNRDPKNPERSASLGRACIAAHRFEEAAPLLEKACGFLSRDTGLLHLLAECYLQIGDNAQAEAAYRRINRLEPYDEDVKAKISSLARA